MPGTPGKAPVPGDGQIVVAEAALIQNIQDVQKPGSQNLALHNRAGFSGLRQSQFSELVLIYLVPGYERCTLEEDGTLATLYIGRRYDAASLEPKGPPKRSSDPEDLRQWWRKATGRASSSRTLIPHGYHGPSGPERP